MTVAIKWTGSDQCPHVGPSRRSQFPLLTGIEEVGKQIIQNFAIFSSLQIKEIEIRQIKQIFQWLHCHPQ